MGSVEIGGPAHFPHGSLLQRPAPFTDRPALPPPSSPRSPLPRPVASGSLLLHKRSWTTLLRGKGGESLLSSSLILMPTFFPSKVLSVKTLNPVPLVIFPGHSSPPAFHQRAAFSRWLLPPRCRKPGRLGRQLGGCMVGCPVELAMSVEAPTYHEATRDRKLA